MTPLFDNIDVDQELSEWIDEPEFVSDIPVHDSVASPLDALEKIVCDTTCSSKERFYAFQSIYTSPYINKNERCTRLLLNVLPDDTLSIEDRFSWLTRLKLSSDAMDVCLYGYVFWFYTYDTPLLYKLLSAQFLLTYPLDGYPFMKTHMKFSQQWLYQLSKRKTESIQIRSEAADILIRLGTPNFRAVAHTVIQDLGNQYVEKRNRTIYTDEQNVHNIKDVDEMIVSLVKKTSPLIITMDDILQWLSTLSNHAALESYQRIVVDTSLYKGYTMLTILCYVFQCIRQSEHRVNLETRLVEELEEMRGWCSTGHVVRILNALQGYGLINMTISFKEEIQASVYSRLHKHLKTCSSEIQDEIIKEFLSDEKSLLEEFVETYSVYDELLSEYSNLIERSEFNAYYHEAVNKFIGR